MLSYIHNTDLHTIRPNVHHWRSNPWSVAKLLWPSSRQGALEGRRWATSYWVYFGTAAVREQTHLTLPATLSTVHNQTSESRPTATLLELLPAAAGLLLPAAWFGSSLPCPCGPPGYARVVRAAILPSACRPVSHQAGFAAMENISLLDIRFGANVSEYANTQHVNRLDPTTATASRPADSWNGRDRPLSGPCIRKIPGE